MCACVFMRAYVSFVNTESRSLPNFIAEGRYWAMGTFRERIGYFENSTLNPSLVQTKSQKDHL